MRQQVYRHLINSHISHVDLLKVRRQIPYNLPSNLHYIIQVYRHLINSHISHVDLLKVRRQIPYNLPSNLHYIML